MIFCLTANDFKWSAKKFQCSGEKEINMNYRVLGMYNSDLEFFFLVNDSVFIQADFCGNNVEYLF